MIAQDIVDKLAANIPLYTSGFSSSIVAISIIPTGTTATAITAAAHGLNDQQTISIIDAEAPVEIDTATFLRTASTAQFSTLQDHDFTLSELDKINGGKTITISGATEAEFNGTFSLLNVLNRRELVIAVDNSGSTTISGSPIVEDANGGIFKGIFTATVIDANTFTYELPIAYTLPAAGIALVQIDLRIAAVLDIEQYLADVYTTQTINADQLIVQLGDVSQNKRRNEVTDASDSTNGNNSFTPILLQPFAVYIVMNATSDLTGAALRDKVESVYIPAIFKCILGAQFSTGFTYNNYRSTFTGHGVFAYSDSSGKNKAIYAHEITFEQLAILDKVADTAPRNSSVAMRDISFTMSTNLGTGELIADIDLDEIPL